MALAIKINGAIENSPRGVFHQLLTYQQLSALAQNDDYGYISLRAELNKYSSEYYNSLYNSGKIISKQRLDSSYFDVIDGISKYQSGTGVYRPYYNNGVRNSGPFYD